MLGLVLSRPRPEDFAQCPILPRLTELDLTASPSEFLAKHGAFSVAKDVIMACKQRYPSEFRVSIKCGSWREELCDTSKRLLFEDVQIRQCVTENSAS